MISSTPTTTRRLNMNFSLFDPMMKIWHELGKRQADWERHCVSWFLWGIFESSLFVSQPCISISFFVFFYFSFLIASSCLAQIRTLSDRVEFFWLRIWSCISTFSFYLFTFSSLNYCYGKSLQFLISENPCKFIGWLAFELPEEVEVTLRDGLLRLS